MKTLTALSLLFVGTLACDMHMASYMEYCSKHGKSYKTMDEFKMRLERYSKIDAYIRSHYEKNGPEPSFHVGHNKFSDWTEQEYRGMLGLKKAPRPPKEFVHVDVNITQPNAWDWREHGAVNPIKDQANCGSCWTFATSAVLEGAHAVATGQLLSFSERLWNDCVTNISNYGYISEPEPCCHGCNGGDYDASFAWAGNNSINLVKEQDYKYIPANGTCEYESLPHTRIRVMNYTDVPANNTLALMAAVAQQPVGVGLDAGEAPFQTYTSGIISDPSCYKASNHAVTAVGYGVRESDSMKFWIVRNSWGAEWGESGYVRIQNTGVNDRGMCGINETPTWATTYTSLIMDETPLK